MDEAFVERFSLWVESPEGKAAIEASIRSAEEFSRKFRESLVVRCTCGVKPGCPWHTPMTI